MLGIEKPSCTETRCWQLQRCTKVRRLPAVPAGSLPSLSSLSPKIALSFLRHLQTSCPSLKTQILWLCILFPQSPTSLLSASQCWGLFHKSLSQNPMSILIFICLLEDILFLNRFFFFSYLHFFQTLTMICFYRNVQKWGWFCACHISDLLHDRMEISWFTGIFINIDHFSSWVDVSIFFLFIYLGWVFFFF